MKQLSILILIACITSSLYSQTDLSKYSTELIPEELLTDANAIVREHDINFEVNSYTSAKYQVHSAITVLNSQTSYDELVVYYSSAFAKVGKVSAALYDQYGQLIKKLRKKDFEDISGTSWGTLADDSRKIHSKINYSTYPYTIVFDYEIKYNCVPYYPNWNIISRSKTAVQSSSYTITAVKGMGVRHKAYNIDATPTVQEGKTHTTYKWNTTNIPAIRPNYFLPKYDEIYPKVRIEPTRFSMGNKKGSKASWKEMGAFYLKLNENRAELPDNIAQEVRTLTANAKTDKEKIGLIYKYLQDNTRYVSIQLGIGGWQTFKAEYVAEKKYGDCKALTNYMKAMLKAVGITSYEALVQGGRRIQNIDENFPADVFNHVILNIPQEGEDDIWLECTSKYDPMNYLGSFTENRHALLITPEGGQLVKTPRKTHQFHRKINTAQVTIGQKGEATAIVKSQMYEDEHDEWRYSFHEEKEKEQIKRLENNIELAAFNVTDLDIKVSNKKPFADINYQLEIRKLAKKTSRRIFIVPNLLNKKSFIPAEKERKAPIQMVKGYTHLDTIIYTIPDGYTIENIPHETFELSTDFGKYNMAVSLEGNQLIYNRQFELFAFTKPKEDYEAIREFYSTIVKVDNMKVVLVKSK